MRHPLLTLATMFALMAPLTLRAPQAQAAAPAAADAATARVIVKFKPGSTVLQARREALAVGERHVERAQALGERVGIALTSGASVSDRSQVVFARGLDSAALAKRLAAEADVEYAVVDQWRHRLAAPNDPLYADGQAGANGPAVGQWYLRAPAGTVKSSIDVEPAWAISTGSASVVVAVLDTGVRFDHVDLNGKLLPGYDMISDPSIANDGDGRDPDASDPGDAVSAGECGAGDPATNQSSTWHGTQTAGLIGAATDNGIGMASVGRNVRILPVRVLGKCGGRDSDIVAGMRWAAGLSVPGVPDNPTQARVINMSLGSDGACDGTLYPDAISDVTGRGVIVVASAGNDTGHAVAVPANCPGVIAVAALRHVGTKVGFSDIGPEVALSAPGGNCINLGAGEACLYPILTTSNSGTNAPVSGGSIYSDSFNSSIGTSFSAPLVAGTAALMLSAQPSLTVSDMRTLLRDTARPFPISGGTAGTAQCHAPNGTDQDECYCTTATCGAGMLDAGAAVAAAIGFRAAIGVTPAFSVVNTAITLSAAGSLVPAGRTIVSTQWMLVDGGGAVTAFDGGISNTATVSLSPTAARPVTVSLTVTDDMGRTASVTRMISVAAVAPPPSGGGGGAVGAGWLLMLAAAAVALRRTRPA